MGKGGGGGEEVVISRGYAASAPADRDPSLLDYSCFIISGRKGGGGGGGGGRPGVCRGNGGREGGGV